MSKLTKLKYVISPDFHKRLLQKDIGNLKTAVPSYEPVGSKEYVKRLDKIVSTLVRPNEAQKVGMLLGWGTKEPIYRLVNENGGSKMMNSALNFKNSNDVIGYLKNEHTLHNRQLLPVEVDKEFPIQVTADKGNQLDEIVAKNSIVNLDTSDDNGVKYILQQLQDTQHDLFVQLCDSTKNQLLGENFLKCLLRMSPNTESLDKFIDTFSLENRSSTYIDDMVGLNLKYDKLTRAKYFCDILLSNGLIPSHTDQFVIALSKKLETMEDRALKFNLLTQGFQQAYKYGINAEVASAILPYISTRSEMLALVSYVTLHKDTDLILGVILNDLIVKYSTLLQDLDSLARNANFASFVKNLQVVYTEFDEKIDKELLLKIYIEQKNWMSAHHLLQNGATLDKKISDIIESASDTPVPAYITDLFK